jgi:hypothetical protein
MDLQTLKVFLAQPGSLEKLPMEILNALVEQAQPWVSAQLQKRKSEMTKQLDVIDTQLRAISVKQKPIEGVGEIK